MNTTEKRKAEEIVRGWVSLKRAPRQFDPAQPAALKKALDAVEVAVEKAKSVGREHGFRVEASGYRSETFLVAQPIQGPESSAWKRFTEEADAKDKRTAELAARIIADIWDDKHTFAGLQDALENAGKGLR